MNPHEEWLAEYWAKTSGEYEDQELKARKAGRLNDANLFQEYAKQCMRHSLTYCRGLRDDSFTFAVEDLLGEELEEQGIKLENEQRIIHSMRETLDEITTKPFKEANMNPELFPGDRVMVFDSRAYKDDISTPLSITMKPATIVSRYGKVKANDRLGLILGPYPDLIDVIFDCRPN